MNKKEAKTGQVLIIGSSFNWRQDVKNGGNTYKTINQSFNSN
jgi:hypothetical protein